MIKDSRDSETVSISKMMRWQHYSHSKILGLLNFVYKFFFFPKVKILIFGLQNDKNIIPPTIGIVIDDARDHQPDRSSRMESSYVNPTLKK